MKDTTIFTADFKEQPYWWDAVPADTKSADAPALPAAADVAIVGAGLTGLSAAWELAKAGRRVVVLDSREPGQGASSRNAGMLGRHALPPASTLIDSIGVEATRAYFAELDQAYADAVERITTEQIDCDYRVCGRFIGAFSAAQHDYIVKEYDLRTKLIGEEPAEVIPASQRIEMASGQYTGGIFLANYANIQPALYTHGMKKRAEKMGAQLAGLTPVTGIVRDGKKFAVHTDRGVVQTTDVIIATNGYTGNITPWLSERLSPINAYMVATEPLPDDVAKSILALRCTYTDTRVNPNNIQMSPDGKRVLFGGRTARVHPSPSHVARYLHPLLVRHFPQLEGVKLSHAWTGRCAAARDFCPHTGVHDGMHYALGYSFAGITVGPYLGAKVAKRILGSPEAKTIFENFSFEKAPWVTRQPWAISMYMGWQITKQRLKEGIG